MTNKLKQKEETVTKDVMFLIGRGENCECSDCPVLYGGECYTGKTPKRRLITRKHTTTLYTLKPNKKKK